MRKVACLILSLSLTTSLAFAQPSHTVEEMAPEAYSQWLQSKGEVWSDEIAQLQAFFPTRAEALRSTAEQISSNASLLGKMESQAAADLQRQTNLLVFSLEKRLENTYADLDRASEPTLVSNF